jgi:thiol-disulfide isomerase/thioredoxin
MTGKITAIGIVVLGCVLAPPMASAAASKTTAREMNAFQKFRTDEMQKYREFRMELNKAKASSEESEAKAKDYAVKMVARFEKFRDSAEGSSFTLEANREIIMIATNLLDDAKKVHAVVASEKDPERALRLKLIAAENFSDSGQNDEAKTMIDDVLAATKEKFPDIRKQAEEKQFTVAPQGLAFPEFPEGTKDLDGKDIKLADYKGKVVMVDFWASWCGPCMSEAPNVVKAYEKYHPKGFEIVGISLDEEKDKMLQATQEQKMPWRQYFDGQGWKNKVGAKYGIHSIPATYLVGPDGKIVAYNLRGEKLAAELEKRLGEKK